MPTFAIKFRFLFCAVILLCACDNDSNISVSSNQNNLVETTEKNVPQIAEVQQHAENFIENKRYLFDVSAHTIEEMLALLERTQEVSETHPKDFEDLEIVMVIHGPDIDWFTKKNAGQNQSLIDLAARLDAYNVIDMKVCEWTMQNRGVKQDDLPSFIEPVPFAPTEIKQRLQDGYINL